ncbi:hypothetical protein BDP67DRAFT_585458 [Colletotrichum lupini]|nr:hypothetical protein BDP67DRAFT_585458 [Colletotrichum lupini]
MVSYTYILTLLAATASIASPTPLLGEDGTIETRAKNDGALYGTVKYDTSIGYLREAKTTAGSSGYPKPFDNRGNVMTFASGCSGTVYELPVLADGKRYDFNAKKGTTNRPGPMRVYYTKDLKFCGIGAKEKADGTGNPHNCAAN